MKELFTAPTIEIIDFEETDVVVASGFGVSKGDELSEGEPL